MSKIMIVVFLGFLVIFPCAPALCAVYSYVDENGVYHFTVIRPVGKKYQTVIPDKKETKKNINKENGTRQPPEATRSTSSLPLPSDWPPWMGPRPPMPAVVQEKERSPSDLFRISSTSVYTVVAMAGRSSIGKKRNNVAVGAAVAISPNQLITNCHIARTRPVIVIKRGDLHERAHLQYADPNTDRCYLQTQTLQLSPVSGIRSYKDLTVGERVYTIGAPAGLENTLGEGIISGLRNDGRNRLIQTSAGISRGSSGGGLFDNRGNLIGITTFYLRESQNLNFAISAEDYWR
jgi:S1-C subfamily serine protease